MAGKSIMLEYEEMLEEVLKSEKAPEVNRKFPFVSLVAARMELEKAVAHFGTCVTKGYHWVRHWNFQGLSLSAFSMGMKPKHFGRH